MVILLCAIKTSNYDNLYFCSTRYIENGLKFSFSISANIIWTVAAGQAMVAQNIDEFYGMDLELCKSHCAARVDCLSFDHSSTQKWCCLNHANRANTAANFMDNLGWVYYEKVFRAN
eukprot:GHVO01070710.1.p1 GENE.GHVO01070710.1~~GHVO01070710.1.p1  ORF type:complete len:117 (-),score=2.24 GHVO01070710.1:187-537(-)